LNSPPPSFSTIPPLPIPGIVFRGLLFSIYKHVYTGLVEWHKRWKCLPSKPETLSSSPSTAKKKKKMEGNKNLVIKF
jgi:hypothetical protein